MLRFVPQGIKLLDASVRGNVAFGVKMTPSMKTFSGSVSRWPSC